MGSDGSKGAPLVHAPLQSKTLVWGFEVGTAPETVRPSACVSINQWRIQDFPDEGAPTYKFVKFFQKLYEIERIWTPRGRSSLAPPLDPPLSTAHY